jgi:hypothetical protein
MNITDSNVSFIFFLTLEDKLPRAFYVFDTILKQFGFMLVPVKVDQLQGLLATTEQNQVIVLCSVTDSREFKIYNDRVRGLLKYVLKSKRMTFMHLSSFTKLSDVRQYFHYKNYYFLRYPLDARKLAAQIARYHDLKSVSNSKWPGGKRAGVPTVNT